jgi:hypothetical protein
VVCHYEHPVATSAPGRAPYLKVHDLAIRPLPKVFHVLCSQPIV